MGMMRGDIPGREPRKTGTDAVARTASSRARAKVREKVFKRSVEDPEHEQVVRMAMTR